MNKLTENQIRKIVEARQINDKKFIVLIENLAAETTEYELNHNIYCIDDQYNIIWQVQRGDIQSKDSIAKIAGGDLKGIEKINLMNNDPFVLIKIVSDKLFANSLNGFEYTIDLENGKSILVGRSR